MFLFSYLALEVYSIELFTRTCRFYAWIYDSRAEKFGSIFGDNSPRILPRAGIAPWYFRTAINTVGKRFEEPDTRNAPSNEAVALIMGTWKFIVIKCQS